MHVEDRVAFITGGASGIGLGMARVFVTAGMKVVISDRDLQHLRGAFEYFTEEERRRIHFVELDVTNREAMKKAADEAEHVFGKIHVLCNNAGVNVFASAYEASIEVWKWVIDVNLFGTINAIGVFIPRIIAHGEGGHIVNTGSMASFISVPHAGPYTTAKFALRGLTECLWADLVDSNIGVSLLAPGLVKTRIHESVLRRADYEANQADIHMANRLETIHAVGMDPVEVGEKTLLAIKRNAFYVFTHPEFEEELHAINRAILAGQPKEDVPAERLAVEDARRQRKRLPT